MLPKGGMIVSNGWIVCFQWMEGILLMDGNGERFGAPHLLLRRSSIVRIADRMGFSFGFWAAGRCPPCGFCAFHDHPDVPVCRVGCCGHVVRLGCADGCHFGGWARIRDSRPDLRAGVSSRWFSRGTSRCP